MYNFPPFSRYFLLKLLVLIHILDKLKPMENYKFKEKVNTNQKVDFEKSSKNYIHIYRYFWRNQYIKKMQQKCLRTQKVASLSIYIYQYRFVSIVFIDISISKNILQPKVPFVQKGSWKLRKFSIKPYPITVSDTQCVFCGVSARYGLYPYTHNTHCWKWSFRENRFIYFDVFRVNYVVAIPTYIIGTLYNFLYGGLKQQSLMKKEIKKKKKNCICQRNFHNKLVYLHHIAMLSIIATYYKPH